MNPKKSLPGIGAFFGILILILDGKTAFLGAQRGIELCIKSVIPALFPFFVLSVVLTHALTDIHLPLLSRLSKHLGIPAGCESVLISGFLGGYPAGAQSIAQLYRGRYLDKDTAQRLLSFCSNAGPSFLFGIVGPMFPEKKAVWALWLIHICGAVFAAALNRPESVKVISVPHCRKYSASDAVQNAIRVMASVCAWIILFRILIAFLERWVLWLFSVPWKVGISGILELSNGCLCLMQITDVPLRFLVCSVLLALGGVCVTMQTSSVTSGLSLRFYFRGKTQQAIFSLLCSLGVAYGIWLPLGILLGILAVYMVKKQKCCSIQACSGV